VSAVNGLTNTITFFYRVTFCTAYIVCAVNDMCIPVLFGDDDVFGTRA